MKKRSILILTILLLCTTFLGCKRKIERTYLRDMPSALDVSSEIPLPEGNQNPLTGRYDLNDTAVGQRPVSVMVSNIKTVKDQQFGLSSADICFETVAEGGITRIQAVFADIAQIPQTGPVRSVREYYVDFVAPYNPLFVHWGGSPTGYSNLAASGLYTIDGMNYGAAFIKDNAIASSKGKEHSQFISGEILQGLCNDTGIEMSSPLAPVFNFLLESNTEEFALPTPASSITAPFSTSAVATFTYDGNLQSYRKGQFGEDHIDANTNEAIYVDNVFILFTAIESFDDIGRMRLDLMEGGGYYASRGGSIPIRWTKGDQHTPFSFQTQEGEPLDVLPGKSWVAILPAQQEGNVSFE